MKKMWIFIGWLILWPILLPILVWKSDVSTTLKIIFTIAIFSLFFIVTIYQATKTSEPTPQYRASLLSTPTPELLIAPKPTKRISIEEQAEIHRNALYSTARAETQIRTATAEAVYWLTPHTPTNIYSPTPEPKRTCNVKGSKNMIYHCKNSPNFSTMTDYTCFSSPEEAERAGYRMSKNVGWCQY